MPIPRTKHAGAADRYENSELINALMQPQTDSHPAAAALEDSAFSAFQFMVESRLLGTTAPAGYAVRRFVQMPTTGFYALRLEIATDCEHLGPGQAELPALECGLGELSPSTWRRGCEVRVNRRMSGKMLGGAEHCASFKVHPPTQLGQHVFGKVQALPQTQLLFGIVLQAVQSIYFLLDSLVNNPGQPVMKYSDMLEPLMTDDSTIGIDDVTDYLKSIIVTTTDVGQVVGLKPSQNNNGLKVVTKAREECAAPPMPRAVVPPLSAQKSLNDRPPLRILSILAFYFLSNKKASWYAVSAVPYAASIEAAEKTFDWDWTTTESIGTHNELRRLLCGQTDQQIKKAAETIHQEFSIYKDQIAGITRPVCSFALFQF